MIITVKEIKYKWLTAFLITLFLFLLVNLFLFPLFNSGDDVFLMYTLAGGYGETPTNLLHYNHIWHPLLGWLVKTLFLVLPAINWYTVVLLFFQWCGWSVVLYFFLKSFRWKTSLVIFLITFFFFGIKMQLSLTFTSTAWILAAGSFLLLLNKVSTSFKKVDYFIIPILLVCAGLLRLHVLLVQVILFIPIFLLYQRKAYKKWGPVFIVVLVIVCLFNIQHKAFYKRNIPNWEKQEKVRQSLFYAFNRPLQSKNTFNSIFKDSTEQTFYFRQFFFDTNFISENRMAEIGHALVRPRDFKESEDVEGLYWFFIGSRVYIMLFTICFFVIAVQKIFIVTFRRWVISTACVFGLLGYLFFFLKFTEPIYQGLWLLLFLYLILAVRNAGVIHNLRRNKNAFSLLLFLLPIIWMAVQIYKKDSQNRKDNKIFKCFISEIQRHPDKLFVTTDDNIPFGSFYIWDSPSKLKARNIIYKDRVITYTYKNTLQQFSITDLMVSIYQNPNVLLLGSDFFELGNYYRDTKNINISLTENLSGYGCLRVRKVSKKLF